MYLALQVILNPGDEVIIHEPYFSPYKDQVLFSRWRSGLLPTYEEDGFQIDVALLKEKSRLKPKRLFLIHRITRQALFSLKKLSEKLHR